MRRRARATDLTWILFLLAALLLLTPLARAFIRPGWLTPFLVWLGVIAVAALLARVWGRDE